MDIRIICILSSTEDHEPFPHEVGRCHRPVGIVLVILLVVVSTCLSELI